MASRSGRRGKFAPESKEFLEIEKKTTGPVNSLKHNAFATTTSPSRNTSSVIGNNDGCKVCRRDEDHANLLLCESCNDEYHIYCLNPPLTSVPDEDFFCDRCHRRDRLTGDDGLDSLVSALPPSYTSRFGEIVWAAGGVGFGWWPACVYDPRLTVGGARQLARKNLGKRHLIYFFECNEAPFTVLGDNRLTKWDDGFLEEYDLGKAAKSGGKSRFNNFERAMHVAQLEHGRPIDMRMDWNHQDSDVLKKITKQKLSSSSSPDYQTKKSKPSPNLLVGVTSDPRPSFTFKRTNLNMAINSLKHNGIQGGATAIEPLEDGVLVCKILKRLSAGVEYTTNTEGVEFSKNLGFITMTSRQNATFAAIRRVIQSDLDDDVLPDKQWKFYVPNLGPMSLKQEGKVGPALDFLSSTTNDIRLGNGTASNPLKIVIVDAL